MAKKRPTTKPTKGERKPWLDTRPVKPPRKPKRQVRCPACGYGTFVVTPFVVPELRHEYLDNGDHVVTLEDHMTDERDDVQCDNCGHEGRWSEFGA